jgi:hypothetical protein
MIPFSRRVCAPELSYGRHRFLIVTTGLDPVVHAEMGLTA